MRLRGALDLEATLSRERLRARVREVAARARGEGDDDILARANRSFFLAGGLGSMTLSSGLGYAELTDVIVGEEGGVRKVGE